MDVHILLLLVLVIETTLCSSAKALVLPSNGNIYEVNNFTDANSAGFNHLTVHNETGDVYVGGINYLYSLNENLELNLSVTTGPEHDQNGEAHDAFNKILVINYDHGDLISCGGYEGVCQKRDLYNLSVTETNAGSVYVAANNTHDSTVGFIAPHYHLGKGILYVGTTSTSSNPGEPLISGRRLEGNKIFEFFDDSEGSTNIVVVLSNILTFRVRYVAGFSYSGYSYFLTTQRKSLASGSDYISKLVRVCQWAESNYFNSYTEVRLKCLNDSYNLAQAAYLTRPGQDLIQSLTLSGTEQVLFVTFSVGENDSPTPTTRSVICMYKMSVLERAFQDAAQGCMEGNGLQEFTAYWMLGATCSGSLPFSRGIHECYALTYYQYANGVDDQYGHAVEDYPSTLVTSIVVTTVEHHTVGFLGTHTGNIFKIHIVSKTYARTYEILEFKQSRTLVLSDMIFDLDQRHFYRLTSSSVHKVKVEACSQYTTCGDCFGSMDPYCGWCTLERRCSTISNCTTSSLKSGWISTFEEDTCIEIKSIQPENGIPSGVVYQITLNVVVLPDEDSTNTYLCNFDNFYNSVAHKDGQNLTCVTPPMNYLPTIPAKEDHITIKLFVKSLKTGLDFVNKDIHIYDCSTKSSCTECVSTDFACNWCVYENRCTHYLDSCPNDDLSSTIVGINNSFNASHIRGSALCPQLGMQDGEVLIPVNLPAEIQLRTHNIYDNKNMGGYECILTVEDEPQTVVATRQNATLVTCNLAKYTYEELHQEKNVSLTLKWNGNFIIDDIHGYIVTLYDCSINRRDCSECLSEISTRLPLNCGWCTGSRTCEVQNMCESEWWPYGTSNKCDFPTITDFFPMSGPYEGRTQIIIMGTDLGARTSDIRTVTVAHIPCTLYSDTYVVSRRFECINGASLSDESGAIVVQVRANDGTIQTATYIKQFIYRDPDVVDFMPKIGPKSGGTMVTIFGKYVNAGRNIEAYFGASSCHIDRTEGVINETHLLCITTMANITNSAKLSMYFDGAERLAPDYKTFVFTNDPEVSSFYPTTSMISGGREINVTGQYFTSVQKPKMFVNTGKLFVSEPCMVHSFDKMKCISPPVELSRVKVDRQVLVGFIMDAVVLQPDLDFEIKDDPVYYPFADDGNIKEYSRGRQLVIEGENLNFASTASEVFVTIGEEECRVVSVSDVQLNCVPSEAAPRGVNKTGVSTENGFPEVRVEVGNLHFIIGYLKYPTAEQSKISRVIPGLVAALALLLIITILIIVICYLRNRKLDNQIAEEVENRLEIMAMGTRTQKDMGLPFLHFCNYTANIISDGQADNPLFKRRLQGDTDRNKSLEQFYSLLVDESFCLVLIRTLEDQKKMTADHKATVGCLLTIILEKERHMLYLTELLKVLLAETAVKANKTRKTRSMLKRNDSIMEKLLTNWFAMTLYTFTKVCMGESVFMMYNAVHGQHNKEVENEMKPTEAVKESVGTVFKECLIVARQHTPVFPAPIKYMFDFMDSLAVKNGIGDRNVAKIWKCDSLHLRLFAKILKRPQSMLDISISRAVGRELDRISQAFIEICSDTKDTPTADLYVENIEHFRKKLRTYIEEVKALPPIDDATLKQYLDEIYQDLSDSFDRMFALDELFYFYIGFKDEIGKALERDEHCRKAGYAAIMDQLIASLMENQYEEIPSNYKSLYANPLVHYESLHYMSNEEDDYQDLQLESEPFYSALDNDQQRLSEASTVQQHSEYQTVQPEPPSQYTTLQSGQQQKREGGLVETEGSVYQPLQIQDNPSQYETRGINCK